MVFLWNTDQVYERTEVLGCHPVMHNHANGQTLSKRPIHFSNVNGQLFVDYVADVNINVNDEIDTYSLVNMLSNEFYSCVVRRKNL